MDHSIAWSQSTATAVPASISQRTDLPGSLLTKTRNATPPPASSAIQAAPSSTETSSAAAPRQSADSSPSNTDAPPRPPARPPTATQSSTPSNNTRRATAATVEDAPAPRRAAPARETSNDDSMAADLALVAHLRPQSISASSQATPAPRVELASLAPMRASESRPTRQSAPRTTSESPDRPIIESSNASSPTEESSPASTPESGEESADISFAPDPSPTPPAATVPARLPQPNLYLPQQPTNQRSGGLLSRLLGRRGNNNNQPQQQPAPNTNFQFNSDYATRSSHAILPAILPGNGINGMDLPIGGEDAYRLTNSIPNNFRPTDLVCLPRQICFSSNPMYLRQEAAYSLCQMLNTAAAEGLNIQVVSAFRDYEHQNRLYMRAVSRHGPDQKRVARPGRSEHYLGTTVDLTNNSEHLLKRSFGQTREGRWLAANAGRFGWKLTVMSGNGHGPNDEPWHLRYFGSALDNPPGRSIVAHPESQGQRRDIFGSIGRALRLRR